MTIQNQIERARKAFEQISDYTQEQVDKLVYEGAKIIYENAKPLAKMAVEETRLGDYESKIGKNEGTAAAFWDYLKDKKSVGIINEEDVYKRQDDGEGTDEYKLLKFKRSNQGTCINQRPIVYNGEHVEKGEVIADGPSTENGEIRCV